MTLGIFFCASIYLGFVSSLENTLSGPTGSICMKLISTRSDVLYDYRRVAHDWWSRGRYGGLYDYPMRWTTREVCCDSYVEVNSVCKPVCKIPCDHGKCVSPNVCECDTGYQRHHSTEQCIPQCSQICFFGECTAPDTCTCDQGYELNSESRCTPVCTKPCTNGSCLAPDFCLCDPGYKFNKNIPECEPECSPPCEFGKCTAPNNCTCDEGYEAKGNQHSCEPVCAPKCDHGWCKAPDTCHCYSGYTFDVARAECVPVCERPCVNATCTAPDFCTCDEGFTKMDYDVFTCEPHCSEECIYASCTAPNTCTCDEGYEKNATSNSTCVPACSSTCGFGDCIAPNECKCHDGYYVSEAMNKTCIACEVDCDHGICATDGCICSKGWEGKSCNSPMFCSVSKLQEPAFTEQDIAELLPRIEALKSDPAFAINWDGPDCHSDCLRNLSREYIRMVDTTTNNTKFLLLVDAPCNLQHGKLDNAGEFVTHVGAIAAGVITAIGVIAVIITVMLIHGRRKKMVSAESTQFLYTAHPESHENGVPL